MARTDLSETLDQEGHIPHGMPDDGLTPPGPPPDNSLQDDSYNNHGNEGPDYPGDLDDKSPESSPTSTRPPSRTASPPPVHPKKARLPHPGDMYGETCQIERDLTCDQYWKKITVRLVGYGFQLFK